MENINNVGLVIFEFCFVKYMDVREEFCNKIQWGRCGCRLFYVVDQFSVVEFLFDIRLYLNFLVSVVYYSYEKIDKNDDCN